MKKILIIAVLLIIVAIMLFSIIRWFSYGGWPSSGPVNDPLPAHILYVTPEDGETINESFGFCVHFNFVADQGMGDEPHKAIRYFMDGNEVTANVEDIAYLEYGYPSPIGEPCYRSHEPLKSGWHNVKVKYSDASGQLFEYRWRFEILPSDQSAS